MTPSRIEMLGSPRMSSGVTVRRVPRPWQSAQTPNGELNENCRGSSSGMESPQVGQANRSEKVTDRRAAAPLPRLPAVPHHLDHPVRHLQRRLDGVVQPAAVGRP